MLLQVLDLAKRAAEGGAGGAGRWEAAKESCLRACAELARARAACSALEARGGGLAGQLEAGLAVLAAQPASTVGAALGSEGQVAERSDRSGSSREGPPDAGGRGECADNQAVPDTGGEGWASARGAAEGPAALSGPRMGARVVDAEMQSPARSSVADQPSVAIESHMDREPPRKKASWRLEADGNTSGTAEGPIRTRGAPEQESISEEPPRQLEQGARAGALGRKPVGDGRSAEGTEQDPERKEMRASAPPFNLAVRDEDLSAVPSGSAAGANAAPLHPSAEGEDAVATSPGSPASDEGRPRLALGGSSAHAGAATDDSTDEEGDAEREALREELLRRLEEEAVAARASAAVGRDAEDAAEGAAAALASQRKELRAALREASAAHAAALAPQLAALREEAEALEGEVQTGEVASAAATSEAAALAARLAEAEAGVRTAQEERAVEAEAAAKAAAAAGLEKLRRAADLAAGQVKAAHVQMAVAESRLAESALAAEGTAVRANELQARIAGLVAAADKTRAVGAAAGAAEDATARDLDLAQLAAENILAERVGLDMTAAVADADLKRESEALARTQAERGRAALRLKRAQLALAAIEELVPPLELERGAVTRLQESLEKDAAAAEAATGELRKDSDLLVDAFLKEEQKGEAAAALCMRELGAQRDAAARRAAAQSGHLRAAREALAVRKLELRDAARAAREAAEILELAELVKHQRNKFVHMAHLARQHAAELAGKVAVANSELGVLRLEAAEKAALLTRVLVDAGKERGRRDAFAQNVSRHHAELHAAEQRIEEQVNELGRLRATVASVSQAMATARCAYAQQLDARNATGLLLLDRGDEVCLLAERAHAQEAVLHRGAVELARRTDEERALRAEAGDVARALAAARGALPAGPALDSEGAGLRAALLLEQRRAGELSAALESPENQSRWRQLPGRVPSKEELAARIAQLQRCLDAGAGVFLERCELAEGMGGLTSHALRLAAAGRADALEVCMQVNEHQARLREADRRLIVAVAEVAVAHATAMQLGAQVESLATAAAAARAAAAAGGPPTPEAERAWQRHLRLTADATAARERAEALARAALCSTSGAPTTAQPRPQAYVPEALGIPKPYGRFSLFKPSGPGGALRHASMCRV
ncbi:hypothetical protein WJX81_003691 [Elliptochloris bilobata]|uniref:Uncharacterized protein n=1 Tax=Elliptochloris bilobata TaxID=381761 RepID=A0AAW1S6V4_9CHLO